MPIRKPTETVDRLRTVARLAAEGCGQSDIAAVLGMSVQQFRYWLRSEGFTASSRTEVRTTLTGESLAELLARDEIVADPAEAVA